MLEQISKASDPPGVQRKPLSGTPFSVTPRRSLRDINNVPEFSSLRSLLALLTHPETMETRYAAAVEQVFTALFYNYLWTDTWEALITSWLGEALAHTVRQIPHRKFKAALPWLSLACQPEAFYDCLCAELLFSLFYQYDDLLDKKTRRYGRTTALGKFGSEGNWRSWDHAHRLDTPAAQVLLADQKRRDLWESTLARFETSENLRVTCSEMPFETYRQQSIRRMGFLGKWWRQAANTVEDTELQRMIDSIYPLTVFTGQIRNDLRNTDKREATNGGLQFSDFTDGRATGVTILVRERVIGKDQRWIESKVWKSKNPLAQDEILKLHYICKDMGALNELRTLVSQNICQIENAIHRSRLSTDVKAIWLGWVFRQYRAEITSPTLAENPVARRFIEAARRLSVRAQEMPLPYGPTPSKVL